ncbi:hypothetical protein PF049_13155 [Erythrobacteraceae bacterium WH01K]|nr:hypothetical protein PF049_13155 [Erythrobacteraceae bacterium WH01K]
MRLATLRDYLIRSKCNKPDQVVALIKACIESGIDKGPEIVSTVSGLGLDKRYVGLILNKSAGRNPERHEWVRGADGRYRVHD